MNGGESVCDLLIIANTGVGEEVAVRGLSRKSCKPMSQKRDMGHPYRGRLKTDLEAEFLDFVVVVLAVEDVPFLGTFGDDAALGGDLLAGSVVDLHFFEEELGEGFTGFLADGVAVFEEVDFVDFGEGVGNGVGELIELVVGDAGGVGGLDVGGAAHGTHRTALYLRASSCFTFLNISG